MKYEFDGMWASSLTDSLSRGKPDIEAVDLTNRLQSLNDALECTTKPIIFDGDTGRQPQQLAFTVRTLERLGVSAIVIEDRCGLKRSSLPGADIVQEQVDITEFCDKIKAGKQARITDDFMIFARVESFICGKGLDDAVNRAFAYVEAGADGIMIHSPESTGADIQAFCEEFRAKYESIPLIVAPTTYNHVTEDELIDWGVNMVIYANHMLRSAYPAMVNTVKSILENGRAKEAADTTCMPIHEILDLLPSAK